MYVSVEYVCMCSCKYLCMSVVEYVCIWKAPYFNRKFPVTHQPPININEEVVGTQVDAKCIMAVNIAAQTEVCVCVCVCVSCLTSVCVCVFLG